MKKEMKKIKLKQNNDVDQVLYNHNLFKANSIYLIDILGIMSYLIPMIQRSSNDDNNTLTVARQTK